MTDEASLGLTGLGMVDSYIKRAVQRRDMVIDNKKLMRDLLDMFENSLEELEQVLDISLHDVDSENRNIKRRLEEYKRRLHDGRNELQSLQSSVEGSHFFTSRVRRHRQLMDKCSEVVHSYRQFYSSVVRPARERKTDIEGDRKASRTNANEGLAQQKYVDVTTCDTDSYVARRVVPPNPPRLTLSYSTTDTYEGKLKAEILGSLQGKNRIVGVVALGLGGVGKTCALRGLADDKQIRETFPDGILFIQLGNDSQLYDVISGIAKCVDRTGGKRLSRTIRRLQTVQEAAEVAGEWFEGHRCLFLVDDVWEVNGITSIELRNLGCMLNDLSLLVYTSRATGIVEGVDKTVVFKEREAHGELARSMLMTHADIGSYENLNSTNKEGVEGILEICQGLPLALAIAGATARKYCEEGDNKQDAWSEYFRDLKVNEENIATGSTKLYGSLWLIVTRSLVVLDSGSGTRRMFTENFKGFCVLRKQQSVGGHMLQKLWSLESLRGARSFAEMFESVSLIRLVRKRENKFFIHVHDLVIDIANEMTSKNQKVAWFRTLLENYVPDVHKQRTSSNVEVHTSTERKASLIPWWSVADDGFLHDNLCRLLQGAREEKELVWLLERAQWIVMRLQEGGISKLEGDLQLGMTVAEECTSDKTEVVQYLELVASAARASCIAVFENAYEAWFQLYGRMVWYAKRSQLTRMFLTEVEDHAPRPWAKPSVGMVDEAGRLSLGTLQVKRCLDILDICHVTGVIRILWVDRKKKAFINEYEKFYGRRKTHKLDSVHIDANLSQRIDTLSSTLAHQWLASEDCTWGAFSCSGNRLVTAYDKGKLLVWDVASGYHVIAYLECCHGIVQVAISGDGQTVAYAANDGRLYVWDVNRETGVGNPIEAFNPGEERRYGKELDMSFVGNRVVYRHDSGLLVSQVHVWDRDAGRKIRTPPRMQSGEVSCVAMSRNGSQVVTGTRNGTIWIWNTDIMGCAVQTLKGHTDLVTDVVFCPNAKRIISTGMDNTARIWDIEEGVMIGQASRTGLVNQIIVSAEGKEAMLVVSGDTAHVLNLEKMDKRDCVEQYTGRVKCVAYCGRDKKVVTGCEDGHVRIWDSESGESIGHPLECHERMVHCVAVSPDGKRIVSASYDSTVRVWDAMSGHVVGERRYPMTSINSVALSNDGMRVACSVLGHIEVWEVESGEVLTASDDAEVFTCVAMSADGALIAFESKDHYVVVLDVQTQQQVTSPLDSRTDQIHALAFSGDGTRLVSASDNAVHVRHVASGEAIGEPYRHDNKVVHVQSDFHGLRVVSYDERGYGQLRDIDRGRCVMTSSDGEWTAALHRDGVAAINWSFEGIIDFNKFRQIVGRNSAGHELVLATLDRPMARVGDVCFSIDYGHALWPCCKIMT